MPSSSFIWSGSLALTFFVVSVYAFAFGRRNRRDQHRLREAVRLGLNRSAVQSPQIDPAACIGCGSCVAACPEGDVLGIVGGRAVVIHGLRCVGHARCEAACPVGALTVGLNREGREDLPYLDDACESSVAGVYVVGELSGLALIRNAVSQGRRAVERIAEKRSSGAGGGLDVAVVGAGPAGLTAALAAVEQGLVCHVFEQEESLGGTILHYPQRKLVLTQPIVLPLGERLEKDEYTREELLGYFTDLCHRHRLKVRFGERVEDAAAEDDAFRIRTPAGETVARHVVLAIGRRGTPRRLGVPGEELPKVLYQLRDATSYHGRRILVVGGGDSAVEAAMALARDGRNVVHLSYRRPSFARIKRKNQEALEGEIRAGRLRAILSSHVVRITPDHVDLDVDGGRLGLPNDDVFVLIGSEPALPLLHRLGLQFGTAKSSRQDPVTAEFRPSLSAS